MNTIYEIIGIILLGIGIFVGLTSASKVTWYGSQRKIFMVLKYIGTTFTFGVLGFFFLMKHQSVVNEQYAEFIQSELYPDSEVIVSKTTATSETGGRHTRYENSYFLVKEVESNKVFKVRIEKEKHFDEYVYEINEVSTK